MIKIIALSGSISNDSNKQFVLTNYVDKLLNIGLLPVVLPYKIDKSNVDKYLENLGGIVFCGGNDINPKHYNAIEDKALQATNEYRDNSELLLLKHALELNMPILGICRGLQLINVGLGGTLCQDIPSHIQNHIVHSKLNDEHDDVFHSIEVLKNTPAYNWFEYSQTPSVNSYHHQCIDVLADDLIACAKTSDGIIEAVYSNKYTNLIAVQWHPERYESYVSYNIFKSFADKCNNYGGANE